RRDGIESRQKASRQLSERETLTAVAKVIATRQHVTGVEILIDLSDEAVDAVEERGGTGKIVAVGATGVERGTRTQRIAWPGRGAGDIGSWPGIARQQCRGDRVCRPIGSNIGRYLRRV